MIRRLSKMQAAWLAAMIVAAALLVYELSAPIPHFDASAGTGIAGEVAALPAPPAFMAPAIQAFSEIDERPLFSPLREPLKTANAAIAAVQAPPPALDLMLMGIVISPEDRFVILKGPNMPTVQNIRIGQEIGGWKLVKIETDHILLRAGASDQEVRLRPKSANATGAGPTPPVGFPPPGMPVADAIPPQVFPMP